MALDLVRGPIEEAGAAVHYAVLRPRLDVARACARSRGDDEPIEEGAIRRLQDEFGDLGEYAPHAIDSSEQTPEATVALLLERLAEGSLRLGAAPARPPRARPPDAERPPGEGRGPRLAGAIEDALAVLPRKVVHRREAGTAPPTPPCGRR